MRSIHLADAAGRDAYLSFAAVKAVPPPRRAVEGRPVSMRRFVAAGDGNTHESLTAQFGTEYGASLLAGDPEVDLELAGRPVASTSLVYLDGDGEVLLAAPEIVEVVLGPDGAERERRTPQDRPPNIAEEIPLRFTRARMKRAEAVAKFAFTRTLQVWHTDGVTYAFLHELAKSLDAADEMVLLGGGASGREPAVFQMNGLPWRAFAEGRVDGPRYQLLLRLSNLELKAPGGGA
jgi:hypothetical protein